MGNGDAAIQSRRRGPYVLRDCFPPGLTWPDPRGRSQ